MREYITKEQALRRFADFGREIPKDQVFEVIASLQEEIVRCRSCIHGHKIPKLKEEVACDIWGGIWTENGFCSCAERSEWMDVKFNGKVRSDAVKVESVVLNCSTVETLIIYDALRLLASSEDKTAVDRKLAERLADKMRGRSEE